MVATSYGPFAEGNRLFDALGPLTGVQGEFPLPAAIFCKVKDMVFSKKLVARYRELKHKAADCTLLMQVGAFMQVMDEDARGVAGVPGLKLQMAGDIDSPVVLEGYEK